MRPNLKPYAWLSIAAAIVTILLKTWAWQATGSVGLLSDALESLVNLAGAVMALWMLHVAQRPADAGHAHGHGKAEYFASGFEGFLINLASIGIGITAIGRLLHPRPLEALGLGAAVSIVAALVNLGVARVLLDAGRRHNSITLEADARHLMTDVFTSGGIVAGLAVTHVTGWPWLDPLLALCLAIHILKTGCELFWRSVSGLMDASLPPEQQQAIAAALEPYHAKGIAFHALLTRQAGARAFVSVHVLVPGDWSVRQGHDEVEHIEADIRRRIPHAHVLTHLEPIEDPSSFRDADLPP
ncbi:MAG: cation diffusion facilitator family transporter [Zoogloeaceae bacterium]|jgi:cation diffusion facilitator family transporter|nr:cation diffusion facilitator family transporter [Zoogloeaceae bacterium]